MEGKWEVFVKELKMVSFLSAPMIAVSFLLYCPLFVSLMMVGHLDELSLSGVSVTTSYATVTGYSLIGLILLSGHLPNPELETSVLLLCLTITDLYYYIPNGFAATSSTWVSNELGAGNAQAAKITFKAIIVLVVAEMVMVAVILLPSCFGLYL